MGGAGHQDKARHDAADAARQHRDRPRGAGPRAHHRRDGRVRGDRSGLLPRRRSGGAGRAPGRRPGIRCSTGCERCDVSLAGRGPGVMAIPQSDQALASLSRAVAAQDDLRLTALAVITGAAGLSGRSDWPCWKAGLSPEAGGRGRPAGRALPGRALGRRSGGREAPGRPKERIWSRPGGFSICWRLAQR